MKKTNLGEIAKELGREPTESNWKAFAKALPGSGAKYYKIFYPKKLKKLDVLKSAYAVIYDSKYAQIARIPVVMKAGAKMQGATIYLESLLNTNKDYKEWVA